MRFPLKLADLAPDANSTEFVRVTSQKLLGLRALDFYFIDAELGRSE